MQIKEGYVPVAGGRVWYRLVGAETGGVPLLALHGGPGGTWDALESLTGLAQERPVVFYDQLGGGKSDPPDDLQQWDVGRFTAELDAVRRTLNLKELHLLGQSWGAMLAVEYCGRFGTKGIQSLVLSGPLLNSADWSADAQEDLRQLPQAQQEIVRVAEKTGNFSSPEYQEIMNEFYRQHLCRVDPWPECLQRSLAHMSQEVYQYLWGPSEFSVTGKLKEHDSTPFLEKIVIPILFTAGEFDEAHPATVKRYQTLSQSYGCQAALHIFQGCSHVHHLEKPAEYLALVGKFLSRYS